jgi:hypothetical protein
VHKGGEIIMAKESNDLETHLKKGVPQQMESGDYTMKPGNAPINRDDIAARPKTRLDSHLDEHARLVRDGKAKKW